MTDSLIKRHVWCYNCARISVRHRSRH